MDVHPLGDQLPREWKFDRLGEDLSAAIQLRPHGCPEGRHVLPHHAVGHAAAIYDRVVDSVVRAFESAHTTLMTTFPVARPDSE